MNSDLTMILREILSHMESAGVTPEPSAIRARLRERGISENLISDALFLLDVIGDISHGKKEPSRPVRVLASEELRGLHPDVVGKLFRLYYLGYMNKEDMETVMTRLLFVPGELQADRARDAVAGLLGITPAQAGFIFDGKNDDSAVVH